MRRGQRADVDVRLAVGVGGGAQLLRLAVLRVLAASLPVWLAFPVCASLLCGASVRLTASDTSTPGAGE
jgi:hypothetical protein